VISRYLNKVSDLLYLNVIETINLLKEIIMSLINEMFRRRKMLFASMLSFFVIAQAEPVKTLHFYDASDNNIMYIEFEYDDNGKNISRSLYMSDGFFVKKTDLTNSSDGIETSFNFNDDTLFSSSLKANGDEKVFSVKDQFGVDQFDGDVKYKEESSNKFNFSQNGEVINKISYESNKINIYDNQGNLLYYAVPSTTGAVSRFQKNSKNPLSLQTLGNNRFVFNFNIAKQSIVSGELISLSGRQVGKLFNKAYASGAGKVNINISKSIPTIASGIYFMNLSVDGKKVMREKILVQRSIGGF